MKKQHNSPVKKHLSDKSILGKSRFFWGEHCTHLFHTFYILWNIWTFLLAILKSDEKGAARFYFINEAIFFTFINRLSSSSTSNMVRKITETYQRDETEYNSSKMLSDSLDTLNLKMIDLRLVTFCSTLLQVTKPALKFKAPVRTIIPLIHAFVYPAK